MKTLLIEFNQDSEYIRYKLTSIPKGIVKVRVNGSGFLMRSCNQHLEWRDKTGLALFKDGYTLIMEK